MNTVTRSQAGLAFWAFVTFALGCCFTLQSIAFISSSDKAVGTVQSCYMQSSGRYIHFVKSIAFVTTGGQQETFSTSDGGSMEVGSQVPVRYMPNDPTNARLDTFESWFGTPALLFICSIGMSFFALRRQSNAPTPGMSVFRPSSDY